jgi:hypothetical protein
MKTTRQQTSLIAAGNVFIHANADAALYRRGRAIAWTMSTLKKWAYVCVVIFSLQSCVAKGSWFMSDVVDVQISVQDEAGTPIPYVTVWRYVNTINERDKFAEWAELKMDDLWRMTTRYQESFEFAHAFNRPVPALHVPPMGDAAGHFKDRIDYKELTGSVNNLPRPEKLNFGYSFMKRGYLPAKVEFTLSKGENRAQAKITLKKDPAQSYRDAALYSELRTYPIRNVGFSQKCRNDPRQCESSRRLKARARS